MHALATSAPLSWNLVDDVRQMFSFRFMVNAYRAGTIAAVVAAVFGWFMVLRRQTFAGHTLAVVGFPGAAGAVLVGVSAQYGFLLFCILAVLCIAAIPSASGIGRGEETALIGTLQAFARVGYLFHSLHGGSLDGVTSLLFGTLFGVTSAQIVSLLVVASVAMVALAVGARPLLFASIDADVAEARGVPTQWLAIGFLVLLGVAAAAVSQITGSLLVFALLVLPPATAQRLTARPSSSLALSIAIGVSVTWIGLGAAFFSPYPTGFWITTVAFAAYASVALTVRAR